MPLEDDFTFFVLDYFFISTLAVAESFAKLDLAAVARRLKARFHGHRFPQWAHLYWSEHALHELVPSGVSLRFTLLHEVCFRRATHHEQTAHT